MTGIAEMAAYGPRWKIAAIGGLFSPFTGPVGRVYGPVIRLRTVPNGTIMGLSQQSAVDPQIERKYRVARGDHHLAVTREAKPDNVPASHEMLYFSGACMNLHYSMPP